MLTYDEGVYHIRCDHCQQEHTTQATAVVMKQFKTLAKSWGWSFDTEHGDLCRACTKAWRLGKLDTGNT